jgi:hypothetical protein
MFRLFLTLLIVFLFAVPALAEDEAEQTSEEALPVIPYYTSTQGTRQFNIPIPVGWTVDDTHPEYLQFSNEQADGDFYIFHHHVSDSETAVQSSIDIIAPDFNGTLRNQSNITFDGLIWEVSIYDGADGGNISAFSQVRDDDVYTIIYANPNAEYDFYIYATEGTIEDVLSAVFPDETFTHQTSLEGIWGQHIYNSATDDETKPLYALEQRRGDNIYAVIQHGEGETINAVSRSLYTMLFGFFITPDNSGYLWLGLAVSLGTILVLIASIYLRYRNAEKDLLMIENLEAE